MKTIKLDDRDYNLLIKILKECSEERSDMTCNDAYEDEDNMFTEEEKIEIQKHFFSDEDYDEDDYDGWLCNFEYVDYIINKIKNQE